MVPDQTAPAPERFSAEDKSYNFCCGWHLKGFNVGYYSFSLR